MEWFALAVAAGGLAVGVSFGLRFMRIHNESLARWHVSYRAFETQVTGLICWVQANPSVLEMPEARMHLVPSEGQARKMGLHSGFVEACRAIHAGYLWPDEMPDAVLPESEGHGL
jgi:hypothetical protein